jgi:hypothetical protein
MVQNISAPNELALTFELVRNNGVKIPTVINISFFLL